MLITGVEKQATYYRKEQKVYQYAHEFWKILYRCGDIKKMRGEIIPLYCYNEMEEFISAVEENCKVATRGGMQFCCKKQAVIRIGINGKSDRLNPKLKRTIRHELIHYFLWLMEMPHRDDDLEFWCYCYAFDGGAYQDLRYEDRKKYDNFTNIYDTKIAELPDTMRYLALSEAIKKIAEDINEEDYKTHIVDSINKLHTFF